ncbi:MAG: (Fe-S)-binding protein [Bacteroidota bacterium]|nr:(Fe-S)-binding protein [Bacteroidota bacterium]
MQFIQQFSFAAIAIVAVYLFVKKFTEIRRNILLGRDEDIHDNPSQRRRNVLLLAFGQKKMFKNPLVAVMHFFVYAGFIIINIEILEIIMDGILGTHRLFASPLGNVYVWLINFFEILAISVLIFCVIFLIRRNIIRIKRFASKDLNGWPRSDANYILITEIILMSLFLKMNACDTLLQARGFGHYAEHITGNFAISSLLHPLLQNFSSETLAASERICWWLHIIGIFAFANYLPYSKHLHIILAFPNAYFAKLDAQGKMQNMPEIQNEVLYAMQPELAPTGDAAQQHIKKFGAKDVFDLSWKNLMDAYSCTECGRCTDACPANITGKLLSPRTIMMKTRDRLEEVGRNINANKEFTDDNKTLLRDYISEEELRACTTCNACVEQCPVSISPLDIIIQLRRYLIMEESNAPQEWNSTFSNIENNFAPWKFSPDERDKWAVEL